MVGHTIIVVGPLRRPYSSLVGPADPLGPYYFTNHCRKARSLLYRRYLVPGTSYGYIIPEISVGLTVGLNSYSRAAGTSPGRALASMIPGMIPGRPLGPYSTR